MTDLGYQLDNFMLYCSSKTPSRKTLANVVQTRKVFEISPCMTYKAWASEDK